MTLVNAYAAHSPEAPFVPFQYELGPIGPEQVDIEVIACGICHSDVSMKNNEWGFTAYPFVPGHEVTGRVKALGAQVKGLTVGQIVGLGWYSESCMHCHPCLDGDHNLCPSAEQTIVNRPGGFADLVRCHWLWATPLPETLDLDSAGPLFCGGLTVFNPIVQNDIRPTHRVGVVGIGGLGHLALQFLNKWGCEVTAFTSSPSKAEEAKRLGAHHVITSNDSNALAALAGSLDFILSTVNVSLDWPAYLQALAPKGRLHIVGVVPEPIPVPAFPLIEKQRSVSGTPLGSPATTRTMLDFCARHDIKAQVEYFPMSEVNEAFAHLESGKARYRVVLKN